MESEWAEWWAPGMDDAWVAQWARSLVFESERDLVFGSDEQSESQWGEAISYESG